MLDHRCREQRVIAKDELNDRQEQGVDGGLESGRSERRVQRVALAGHEMGRNRPVFEGADGRVEHGQSDQPQNGCDTAQRQQRPDSEYAAHR